MIRDSHLLNEADQYLAQSADREKSTADATGALPVEPRTAETIQAWMVARLAAEMQVPESEIDIELPFTDYGLESITVFTLTGDLAEWLDRDLTATLLWEYPTVETLARHLAEASPGQGRQMLYRSLVAIQPLGPRPPFFCVHPIRGGVLAYHDLAQHLGTEQPFYGFQALHQEQESLAAMPRRIEDMAQSYIEELRAFQPEGPYYLGGYSSGGVVAYEMARQLRAQNQEIALLALFDSEGPSYTSWTRRLKLHARILRQLDGRERLRYTWSRVSMARDRGRNKARYLSYKMKRRFLPEPLRPPKIVRHPVAAITLQACRDYKIPSTSNHVTLFRSMEYRPQGVTDFCLGWSLVAGGGIEIYEVPGSHASFVKEPHVRVLAAQLERCLLEAQARCTSKG
jgi:thioesterase domain-containing protein/acyl carrier protein